MEKGVSRQKQRRREKSLLETVTRSDDRQVKNTNSLSVNVSFERCGEKGGEERGRTNKITVFNFYGDLDSNLSDLLPC